MAEEKDFLVVNSKTKADIKGKGLMMSSDALASLNAKVYGLIDAAAERTSKNKRSTVRPHDF